MRYLRARSADGQTVPDDAGTIESIYIYAALAIVPSS